MSSAGADGPSWAAVSVVLEELSHEYAPEGIHTAEIRAGAGPAGGCARTVIRALEEPAKPEAAHRVYRA